MIQYWTIILFLLFTFTQGSLENPRRAQFITQSFQSLYNEIKYYQFLLSFNHLLQVSITDYCHNTLLFISLFMWIKMHFKKSQEEEYVIARSSIVWCSQFFLKRDRILQKAIKIQQNLSSLHRSNYVFQLKKTKNPKKEKSWQKEPSRTSLFTHHDVSQSCISEELNQPLQGGWLATVCFPLQ